MYIPVDNCDLKKYKKIRKKLKKIKKKRISEKTRDFIICG